MIAFTVTMHRSNGRPPYEIVVVLPHRHVDTLDALVAWVFANACEVTRELVTWLAATGRIHGMSTSDTLSGIREFRNGELVNGYLWIATEHDIYEASEGTRTRG